MHKNQLTKSRVFRISLKYAEALTPTCNWVYQYKETWEYGLKKKKQQYVEYFKRMPKDMSGVHLISEEFVNGEWVLVEDWCNSEE